MASQPPKIDILLMTVLLSKQGIVFSIVKSVDNTGQLLDVVEVLSASFPFYYL